MTDRAAALAAFLLRAGWGDAARAHLAGDASARQYLRLTRQGGTAVLMDAPPDSGETVAPFVTIARHLRALGLAAPEVMAAEPAQGFLLLEDLGDDLFARVLDHTPEREGVLYALAVDLLLALHRHPPPAHLPPYQPPFPPGFIAPAYGWYLPGATGHLPDSAAPFCDALNAALIAHGNEQSVLMLRDFHAENLVLRPGRDALAQVGLLDFQDAMAAHPAYDLVSLLEDARRDVSHETASAMIDRYIAGSGRDAEPFRAACAVLGAQRNLRILGVFARLCLHFGKARYVALLPRVWGHLMRDLEHPALAGLRTIVLADLPPPTPDHLNHLRARCATLPMP